MDAFWELEERVTERRVADLEITVESLQNKLREQEDLVCIWQDNCVALELKCSTIKEETKESNRLNQTHDDAESTKDSMQKLNDIAAAAGADTEGLKAWHILTKSGPVTQATFLAWYATRHKKKTTTKRGTSSSILSNSKPAAKKQRQAVLPGTTAADTLSQQPTTLLTKGKRTALVKAITSSLKASIKAKKTKWHAGDHDVKAGTAVMDATDFVALFPGVSMTRKGVTTSFSLTKEVLIDTLGDFKLSISTWSMPRNFRKAYKTGSKSVSLHGADGKYSTGTSTLTLKFSLSIGGGWGDDDGDY